MIVDGELRQTGTPGELVAEPNDPFVASFTGANLLHGHAEPAGDADARPPRRRHRHHDRRAPAAARSCSPSIPGTSPSRRAPPHDSAMNLISGPIDNIAELGNRVRVTIGPVSAEITADSLASARAPARADRLRLVQGDRHADRRQRSPGRRADGHAGEVGEAARPAIAAPAASQPDCERGGELGAAGQCEQQAGREGVAGAERARAVDHDRPHHDARRRARRRGDRAFAPELDAADAVAPGELERRCLRVSPVSANASSSFASTTPACASPRGNGRRRTPSRGSRTLRRRRARAFARARAPRARPLRAPAAGANSRRRGPTRASSGCRHIPGGEQRARAGIGDDRRAAEDDDAARRRGSRHARASTPRRPLPGRPPPTGRRRPRRCGRRPPRSPRGAPQRAPHSRPTRRRAARCVPWTRRPGTGAGSAPSSMTSPTAIRSGGTSAPILCAALGSTE